MSLQWVHHLDLYRGVLMPFYFCFLSFFFSVTLPAVRISLLFFFLNLVSTEDVTDPGLLKIPLTLTSLSPWFCLQKCPLYWAAWGRNFIAQSWVINIKYSARLSSMFVRNRWEIYTSSPSNKDGKMVHFGFCAVSSLIFFWGGGRGGGLRLLFHFSWFCPRL